MPLIVWNLALQPQKLGKCKKSERKVLPAVLKESYKVGPEFYHPVTSLLQSLGKQLL